MQLDAERVADLRNLARCNDQPPLDAPLDDGESVSRRKGRDEFELGRVGAVLARKLLGSDVMSRARSVLRPMLLIRQFGRPGSPAHGDRDGHLLIGIGGPEPFCPRRNMPRTVDERPSALLTWHEQTSLLLWLPSNIPFGRFLCWKALFKNNQGSYS